MFEKIIPTNHQYGQITRLPERYPLTTVYYRELLPPHECVPLETRTSSAAELAGAAFALAATPAGRTTSLPSALAAG